MTFYYFIELFFFGLSYLIPVLAFSINQNNYLQIIALIILINFLITFLEILAIKWLGNGYKLTKTLKIKNWDPTEVINLIYQNFKEFALVNKLSEDEWIIQTHSSFGSLGELIHLKIKDDNLIINFSYKKKNSIIIWDSGIFTNYFQKIQNILQPK